MGDTFGVHRVDETQIVNMLRDFREQGRDRATALTMAAEVPSWGHESLRTGLTHTRIRDLPGIVKFRRFSVSPDQFRFEIEAVNMAGAALHEEEDDPLRF
jgi:hypothetical protein